VVWSSPTIHRFAQSVNGLDQYFVDRVAGPKPAGESLRWNARNHIAKAGEAAAMSGATR